MCDWSVNESLWVGLSVFYGCVNDGNIIRISRYFFAVATCYFKFKKLPRTDSIVCIAWCGSSTCLTQWDIQTQVFFIVALFHKIVILCIILHTFPWNITQNIWCPSKLVKPSLDFKIKFSGLEQYLAVFEYINITSSHLILVIKAVKWETHAQVIWEPSVLYRLARTAKK